MINRVDRRCSTPRSWAQAARGRPPAADGSPNPARPPSHFYVRGIDGTAQVWLAINDQVGAPRLPTPPDDG